MGKEKRYPYSKSGLTVYFIIVAYIFPLVINFMPRIAIAQNRGLGFRGLVPPAGVKQNKYKIKVETLDLPLIKAQDSEGHFRKVFIGPPYFLNESGFDIHKGQRLIVWAVSMKIEGKEVLVAFRIKDKDTDKELFLRNKKGEPLWWSGNSGPQTRPDKNRRSGK